MNLDLDAQALTLGCPACDAHFDVAIARLKTSPASVCPQCGMPVQLAPEELRRGIDTIRKMLYQIGAGDTSRHAARP